MSGIDTQPNQEKIANATESNSGKEIANTDDFWGNTIDSSGQNNLTSQERAGAIWYLKTHTPANHWSEQGIAPEKLVAEYFKPEKQSLRDAVKTLMETDQQKVNWSKTFNEVEKAKQEAHTQAEIALQRREINKDIADSVTDHDADISSKKHITTLAGVISLMEKEGALPNGTVDDIFEWDESNGGSYNIKPDKWADAFNKFEEGRSKVYDGIAEKETQAFNKLGESGIKTADFNNEQAVNG